MSEEDLEIVAYLSSLFFRFGLKQNSDFKLT